MAHETEEARRVPAALTARAKQERRRNDQERRRTNRASDWLIVSSGKAQAPKLEKGPTSQRSLHRQPAPKEVLLAIYPRTGTPQGGIISPVLANIYLHYALDLWFERVVRPHRQGCCRMIRSADDFVACFEYRHEAEWFERALPERLAKFGLEVATDKTRTLRFGRNGGLHNGRFDFLGFEFYWEPDRQGKPRVKRRTATKKYLAGKQRIREWIETHRHQPLRRLMKILKAKLQGTWNYYGLIGNYRRMKLLYDETCRALHKWLNRRSQRRSIRWRTLNRLLQRFQVPQPRIVEKHGQRMPCPRDFSFCQRLLTWPVTHPSAHARAS